MKARLAVLLAVMGLGLAVNLMAQFVFFPVTERFDEPPGICLGPDGNIWFTVGNYSVPSRVGRITLTGETTSFYLSNERAGSGGIVTGPDGNLWFLEGLTLQVGRITPGGAITEFPIPANSRPSSIAVGPDGAIWFSDDLSAIWRVSLSGMFTRFPVPASPFGLATGSDNNLWFTVFFPGRLGRMTTSGASTLFSRSSQEYLSYCALGPDGNIWYGTFGRVFGRITPSGAITEFGLSGDRGRNVTSVAVGPDGNLWMPVNEDTVCPLGPCPEGKDGVLRVSVDGVQKRYELGGDVFGEISKIAMGPNGSMWLTARGGLIRFFPSELAPPSSVPVLGGLARVAFLTLLVIAGLVALSR